MRRWTTTKRAPAGGRGAGDAIAQSEAETEPESETESGSEPESETEAAMQAMSSTCTGAGEATTPSARQATSTRSVRRRRAKGRERHITSPNVGRKGETRKGDRNQSPSYYVATLSCAASLSSGSSWLLYP